MVREGKKMHRENLEVSFIHSPTLYLSLGETSSKTLGDNNDLGDNYATGGKIHSGEKNWKEISGMVERGKPEEPLWGCHVIRSLMESSVISQLLLAQAAVTSGLCHEHPVQDSEDSRGAFH